MEKTQRGCLRALCALFALLFLLAAYAPFDGQTASVSENRALEARPALTAQTWFSGAFAPAAERYLNDHVLLRARLIRLAQAVEACFSLKTDMRIVNYQD